MSTIMIINIVITLISLALLFLLVEDGTSEKCYMYTTVRRRYWWLPVILIIAVLLLSLVNLYLIDAVYIIEV